MTPEELKEFREMQEWYRKYKYGSFVVLTFFSISMAVGGAYLMAKSIIAAK